MREVYELELTNAPCPPPLGRCPLWVKSKHRGTSNQCLLYPQKRTWSGTVMMSALYQKRTSTCETRWIDPQAAVAFTRAVRLFSSTVGTYPGQRACLTR